MLGVTFPPAYPFDIPIFNVHNDGLNFETKDGWIKEIIDVFIEFQDLIDKTDIHMLYNEDIGVEYKRDRGTSERKAFQHALKNAKRR